MPDTSFSDYLASWFNDLSQFQIACNNTTILRFDLLTFANANILQYFTTTTEQNSFLVSVASSTDYDDISIADLSTYKTFVGLLNNWNVFPTGIAQLLQTFAIPTLQNDDIGFMAATVVIAFPGGSSGDAWTAAFNALKTDIKPACFSATFQQSINDSVTKPGMLVKDLINQIAVLG